MAQFTEVLNNFSGGKVSEKFKGRNDLAIYKNSLLEFNNFLIGKIGGAYKRTGSVTTFDLTNISSDFSNAHTAIPFDSGRASSYTVYLPNGKVKLDGGVSTKLFIAVNDGNGLSSPTVYFIGSGITANTVSSATLPAWPSTALETFSSGTWVWQQVGDILFLTHTSGEQRPLAIARTSETTFEINYYDTYFTGYDNFSLIPRVPYIAPNVSSTTMSISGTTMTASAAYFTADMVGSLFKITVSGTTEVVSVMSYTNSTTVTINYLLGSSTTTATTNWQQSAWCDEYGWPTSVTYHQQRLFWGGNKKFYDYVWGTLTGNLFHLMRRRLEQDSSSDVSGINYFGDAAISDPFDVRPASQYANSTTWLSGGRVLMIGTTGGENLFTYDNNGIDLKENSNYGSSTGQVVKAGKDVIYIGKDGRSLRTYRYSEDNGSWLSDDLSSKLENSFLDGVRNGSFPKIKQISWNSDNKHLWVLLDNGQVNVISYDPEYGLMGWSEVNFGGETTTNVLGVIQLPSPDRSRFETYFTVERRTEGTAGTKIFQEKIMGEFINDTVLTSASSDIYDYPRYLDFSRLTTADASGEVSGIDLDLLGNTFDVIYIDSTTFGYATGVEVIGTGELDYTFPANAKVIYGYAYDAELTTMPIDAGGDFGSALGDLKDIHETYVLLYRTKEFKIGTTHLENDLDVGFEEVAYDELTTTKKQIQLFDDPDLEGQVTIRSTTPTPLNVLGLVLKGESKR